MRLRAAVAALLVLAACGGSDADVPARRADLDTLSRAVATHPSGVAGTPEWRARLARLRRDVGGMNHDRLLVEVARLAVLGERDGHGGVFPYDQPGLETWPLRLYAFDDGLRLVSPAGALPVGTRLVSIGGRDVAAVADAVRPMVPYDNEQTLRARLPAYVVVPAFLRGLGIPAATLVWERPGGTRESLPPPAPVPVAEWAATVRAFAPQVPPALPGERQDEPHWWKPVNGGAYVVMNQVTASGDPSLDDVVSAVRTWLARRPRDRLVLDLRRNPGGEVEAGTGMVTLLRARAAAYPGTVYVLVGRATFSAAALMAADLAAAPGVVLLGEPTGGAADPIADPAPYALPALDVVVHVSSRRYTSPHPAVTVEPDRLVPTTWQDVAARRDPVLAAALA